MIFIRIVMWRFLIFDGVLLWGQAFPYPGIWKWSGMSSKAARRYRSAIISPLFFCMRSRGGASETKLTLRANRRCKKKKHGKVGFRWSGMRTPSKHYLGIIIATVPFPCPFTHLPILFWCDQGTLEWDVSLSIYSKKNLFPSVRGLQYHRVGWFRHF